MSHDCCTHHDTKHYNRITITTKKWTACHLPWPPSVKPTVVSWDSGLAVNTFPLQCTWQWDCRYFGKRRCSNRTGQQPSKKARPSSKQDNTASGCNSIHAIFLNNFSPPNPTPTIHCHDLGRWLYLQAVCTAGYNCLNHHLFPKSRTGQSKLPLSVGQHENTTSTISMPTTWQPKLSVLASGLWYGEAFSAAWTTCRAWQPLCTKPGFPVEGSTRWHHHSYICLHCDCTNGLICDMIAAYTTVHSYTFHCCCASAVSARTQCVTAATHNTHHNDIDTALQHSLHHYNRVHRDWMCYINLLTVPKRTEI